MTNKKSLCIIGASIIIVLIMVTLPVLAVINVPSHEKIVFRVPIEPIPEGAVVIKLTEEDYEKYPILRNIPESFYIDKGILSDYYIRPGCVDKETGYAIIESYGYIAGGWNRYIEHNGTIYQVNLRVS